jgi:hypothetical protein
MNNMFKKDSIIYLLIIAALGASLTYVIVADALDAEAKERDAVRISNIEDIHYALYQYFDSVGTYPPCLYKTVGCKSLEGSSAMSEVPKDPATNLPYAYAAIGSGSYCRNYHIGVSLERKGSQALLAGSDAGAESAKSLCVGSAPDFSGLSYAPGGHPCNDTAGIAQPTDDPKGESCFDLKPTRPR